MKVLLLNQYAGNKGDRAVAYFELRELLKDTRVETIHLSTSNTKSWENDLFIQSNSKIKIIPWGWNVDNFNAKNRVQWERRRFMKKVVLPLVSFCYNKKIKIPAFISAIYTNRKFLNALQHADTVISTGGHHLTTRFSANLNNEIFFDLLTASMYKPLILWSQTYGPFHFSDKTAQKACCRLLQTSRVICRDLTSPKEIQALNINPDIELTYETVIGLENEIQEYIKPSARKKTVGITIYNAESRSAEEYFQYLHTMAQATDYLTGKGYKVKFFPHEIRGAAIDDRKCINDIVSKCNNQDQISIDDTDKSTNEHLNEISKCSMFIGHKTHSIVFALTVGTPLLAIAYHSKTIDFLKQYQLESNIIEETHLDGSNLINKIARLLSNLDEIGDIQIKQSKLYGSEVRNKFKTLTR